MDAGEGGGRSLTKGDRHSDGPQRLDHQRHVHVEGDQLTDRHLPVDHPVAANAQDGDLPERG